MARVVFKPSFTATTVPLWATFLCCWISWMADGLQKPFSPQYPKLHAYHTVDPRLVSVSGFSNGAAFSTQLAFIYSSVFHAVGVFSGYPYPIAQLVYGGQLTNFFKSHALYSYIEQWAAEGAIDPLVYMRGKKVYTYIGILDFFVPKYSMFQVVDEFKHYGAHVRSEVLTYASHHCVPTDNWPPTGDYIPILGTVGCVCNAGYEGVNDMFHHFYGSSFIWPRSNNATPTGHLFKFDQNEYFDDEFAEGNGFSHAAFAYVPRACAGAGAGAGAGAAGGGPIIVCKLHIALHGAVLPLLNRVFEDGFNDFVYYAGYLQAADANNIIVLFPEASIPNVFAFDVWGGWTTNISWKKHQRNFLFKNGTHVLAIRRMVARILGEDIQDMYSHSYDDDNNDYS